MVIIGGGALVIIVLIIVVIARACMRKEEQKTPPPQDPTPAAPTSPVPLAQGMVMPEVVTTFSNPEMTAPGIDVAKLKELKDLLDAGILTQTEFDAQKKIALGTLAA